MNVLVIGASGRTGKFVVEQGIERGYAITAFVRSPQKIAGIRGLSGVVQGDALDLADVRRAVQGQDAVIAAVGMSGIARNLIATMPEAGARRLIMTSSRSVVATRPAFWVSLAWLIYRDAYADLARAEGMLEVSDLDWTVVRATMLNDKPATGRVHIDFEANATGGDWQLPRADYAMTLLDALDNPQWIRRSFGVGGAKSGEQAHTVKRIA